MSQKDMEFASNISQFARHVPEVWNDYQDWLREIVASYAVLEQKYPTWQTVLIFRWRLLYFLVYIAIIMIFNSLVEKVKGLFVTSNSWKAQIVSEKVCFLSGDRYYYILQRTATLLAVAELTLCAIAALTGILLAFYYQPVALGAYASLSAIAHNITYGTLIISLHHIAGNGLVALALVQIIVMFLGRQFLLSWLTGWISGILLTLTAIGLGWTAIILNWDQIGFWRFKLELNMVGSLPLVGSMLRDILSGGSGISSLTLQHMYTLHSYILAIFAVILAIVHLTALIYQEQYWKQIKTPIQ